MIVALAGGVGGARLADGLASALPPGELLVAVNTGDDFTHLGLEISPDLDTVLYTLAGIADEDRGWGLAGESWQAMDAIGRLGGETWVRLGDRDLATHIERTRRLRSGETLSAITSDFAARLGIRQELVPMSDDPVRTVVETDAGTLAFQDYFVRRQCAPRIAGISFQGADEARPSARLLDALASSTLEAVIICPSNPFLSLGPILAMPALRAALAAASAPVVAVSPIIAGAAVKGPAAKIMTELGLATAAATIASHYGALLDGFILDHADQAAARDVAVPTNVTDILMRGRNDRTRLAREVIAFALSLQRAGIAGGVSR
jgi:LPPG:FO 2-phospho-L-lactate transferase